MWRYLVPALLLSSLTLVPRASELPDPLAAGWEGRPVCERLHEDAYLRILRCTFAPGVGHEKHYHPPHVGYVLRGGTLQITDAEGTRTVELPDGDLFSNPDGIRWHEGLNVGDSESSYLMIEPKRADSGR
jgi:quercetin dioxygenase-like cupin family protein